MYIHAYMFLKIRDNAIKAQLYYKVSLQKCITN